MGTTCVLALTVGALGTGSAAAADAPEQITNGGFDDGLTGWNAYPAASVVDGRGCIDVPAGNGAYSAAIAQNVPLLAGETYALSVDMLTEPATEANVRVVVQAGADLNYQQFLPAQKAPLTPEEQSFRWTFTPEVDYPSAELAFQQDITNAGAYRLCVDDVSLTGGAEPEEYEPDTGPRVRVNQVGYLPDGPEARHRWSPTRPNPLRWRCSQDGTEVARGQHHAARASTPPPAPTVHTVDFSRVRAHGRGLHPGRRRRDEPPVRHRGRPVRAAARRRDDVLLHQPQRHRDPRRHRRRATAGPPGHVGVAPNQGDTEVPLPGPDDDSQLLFDEPGPATAPAT